MVSLLDEHRLASLSLQDVSKLEQRTAELQHGQQILKEEVTEEDVAKVVAAEAVVVAAKKELEESTDQVNAEAAAMELELKEEEFAAEELKNKDGRCCRGRAELKPAVDGFRHATRT